MRLLRIEACVPMGIFPIGTCVHMHLLPIEACVHMGIFPIETCVHMRLLPVEACEWLFYSDVFLIIDVIVIAKRLKTSFML